MGRGLKLTNTRDWNATEDPILCWQKHASKAQKGQKKK